MNVKRPPGTLRVHSPLDGVIAAADAINHAVLRHDELELAVQLLEGAGLVSIEGDVLRLTEAGRSELREAQGASWLDGWARLRTRLLEIGLGERSDRRLDPAAFRAAVDRHLDPGWAWRRPRRR